MKQTQLRVQGARALAPPCGTQPHSSLNASVPARRSCVAHAAEPTTRTSISQLHDELLREIEERRKAQQMLLERLNKLSAAAAQQQQVEIPIVAPPPIARYTEPIAPPSLPPVEIEPDIYLEPDIPVPEPIIFPDPEPIIQSKPAPVIVDDAASTSDPQPPLAGPNVMKVVMVGAECAPWSKTGGLGDVMAALPKAMKRRGHRTMVVVPRYANYPEAWETGVRVQFNVFNSTQEVGYFHGYLDGVDYVFVDHPCFHNREKNIYGGDRLDLMFRCALLCKAALEAIWHVPCGGVPYGDDNCVFIANDWHTALLPVFLQAHYRDYGKMTYTRCCFVIHNMAHQGRGPFVEVNNLELNDHYKEIFRLYDPIGGEHMNIMKAGLQFAHRLVAVSHGYAWECQTVEGGWGLHQILKDSTWKLRGIVNGIDYAEWSPMNDVFLQDQGYVNFSTDDFEEGKKACKMALQRELGLPVDPDIPLFGFIGRLDYQKGVDLIRDSFDWLMNERVQLVLLGSGREDLEAALRDMENRRKDQCRGWVGFSVKMAHRITAGCDMLLMPSRFEPCGLNQLYAMAYGTVPIVHAVGGLRDTVKPFNPFENSGTGWTFDRAEATQMRSAVGNALHTYRQYREAFRGIQRRGMEQDLSWDNAAQQYEEVLVAAKFQW